MNTSELTKPTTQSLTSSLYYKVIDMRFLFLFMIFTIGFVTFSQTSEEKIWQRNHKNEQINSWQITNNLYTNKVLGEADSLVLIRSKKDHLNVLHNTFQQYHNGIPVEHAYLTQHIKNNTVIAYNGNIIKNIKHNISSGSISKLVAIDKAKAFIDAKQYAWEDIEYTELVKKSTDGHVTSLFPEPELVLLNDSKSRQATLVYKLEIHTTIPQGRKLLFIDAADGTIIQSIDLNHHLTYLCGTLYHGNQFIDFDSPINGTYYLTDNTRNVETYLLPDGETNYSTAFLANSNFINWSPLIGNDRAALDVHWGTQVVYDFFHNNSSNSIDSYDDNGATIKSYANYGSNILSQNNAFWNGFFLTYGSGGGNSFPGPVVTLDVIAHEYCHALTEHYGGGLFYQGESGAINESMSDILASLVEKHVNNALTFNALTLNEWIVSDQNGNGIRDLSNPNASSQPDTYQGINWISPLSNYDNGGVHINSGVGNYWYYLLASGGSGTNDFGYNYNVSSLSYDSIRDIIIDSYNYMNNNATYLDFRNATITAAELLYNDCATTQKVIDAWNAVGVGDTNQNCNGIGSIIDIENLRSQYCVTDTFSFNNAYQSAPNHIYFWELDNSPVTMPINIATTGFHTLSLIAHDTTSGSTAIDEIQIFIENCQPLQSRDQLWYFGKQQGFDFSSGIAVPTTYPFSNFETTTLYSAFGELEFYVSANQINPSAYDIKLLDKNHQEIADLDPIFGSSLQIGGSAPSPDVGPDHHYVNIFLNASFETFNSFCSGLYKVVVDINTPGSPAFVSINPVQPSAGFDSDSLGAVCAGESTAIIPGCDPYTYWVLFSPPTPTGITVYKLDYSSTSGSPEGLLTYSSHLNFGNVNWPLNTSPNGEFIVTTDKVFNFDKVNGVVTFNDFFPPQSNGQFGAFSSNSRFYYTSQSNVNEVYQYDLMAPDFGASKTYIGDLPITNFTSFLRYDCALGPDGKIYISNNGAYESGIYNNAVSVINNPNVKALNGSTLYNKHGYFLPQSSEAPFILFPSFTTSNIPAEEPLSITTYLSNCTDVTFAAPACKAYYTWSFGDGDSLIGSSAKRGNSYLS